MVWQGPVGKTFVQRAPGSQRVCHEGISKRNVPGSGNSKAKDPSGYGEKQVALYIVNVWRGQGWLRECGLGVGRGRLRALKIWILDFILNEIRSNVEAF